MPFLKSAAKVIKIQINSQRFDYLSSNKPLQGNRAEKAEPKQTRVPTLKNRPPKRKDIIYNVYFCRNLLYHQNKPINPMKAFHILKSDECIREALTDKINNRTKPKGSLPPSKKLSFYIRTTITLSIWK